MEHLNAYQVYIVRELVKTPNQFKDIIHTRALWLTVNLDYNLQIALKWEVEMLLAGFICIDNLHLHDKIKEDCSAYEYNIPLKLTSIAREYLASWSEDMIFKRKLQDRIHNLQKTIARKKGGNLQPIIPSANSIKAYTNPTIAALGIMFVYIKMSGGQGVTMNNRNLLAAKYNRISKTSGKQLYDEYNNFNNGILASDKVHLKRLLSIRDILLNEYPQAIESLEKDIFVLQKRIR